MLQPKLTNPLITNKFTLYPGDTLLSTLSLAILIKDDYSGRVITSGIQVFLKGENRLKPILNVSGYYCFMQLGDGTVTIVVEPNLGSSGVFFKHEQSIDLSTLDPKDPSREILLIPKPNYLFPKQATLIRGRVVNINNEGIEDASFKAVYVAVQNNNGAETEILAETRSDQQGEFVLALKRIEFKNKKKPLIIKDIEITVSFETIEKTVLIEGNTADEGVHEGDTFIMESIQFP
ncbi:MAG: hypothetical protein DHS20C13_28790 [Thermodesulfobacteriota bacterium]|nr:MAG: hypothetical protein DHS20C13_28790 [Thermodesulfobacteriota bacterium]